MADITTSSMEAYKYYLEGRENNRKLYFDEARIALEKAVELDPNFAAAHYALYVTYAYLQKVEASKAALRKAYALSSKASERGRLLIEYSYSLRIENDQDKALRLLQQIAERFPDDKRTWFSLGNNHHAKGDFDSAIREFNKALELDPDYGEAHNMLGYSYAHKGDFSKAIEHEKKYVALSPGEANPLDSLAEIYFWAGRLDEAAANYHQRLERSSRIGTMLFSASATSTA